MRKILKFSNFSLLKVTTGAISASRIIDKMYIKGSKKDITKRSHTKFCLNLRHFLATFQ